MLKTNSQPYWMFTFGLEGEGDKPVSRDLAEELLLLIVKWAEENECQIGGGFRPPEPEEC